MNFTKWTGLARKLPSPIYKVLAQSQIDYEFPRHIFIETCATCNLSCSYCPREKINKEMDYELFKEIINESSQYGPRSFSLHLFGEPLLYSHIIEAIAYIKHKNKRHTVLLTTNGTLLNKFVQALRTVQVDRVIWSYRKNNFNSDSIKFLKEIGLIRLLLEETPKEEFERWSKFPRVEIKHLHNYGGNIDVKKWGIKENSIGTRYPCYHLWLAPAVRWNGDITICCNDPNGRETYANYCDCNIAKYWKSSHLETIRKSHMNKQYKGICTNCTSWQAYPDIWFKSQCSG